MKLNKINYFNIDMSFKNLSFLFNQIKKGKSYLRATHNLFLKNKINLKGSIANLGSGKKNDYSHYINKNNYLLENYDFFKTDNNVKQLNLEKKFVLRKKYNSIILFNVLEHIYHKEQLLNSIKQSLKVNGRFELFLPFMYRHHNDPDDYYRLTYSYLKKFLKKKGFKIKITLIGVGQLNVVLEIFFNHLKINLLKFLVAVVFIILNKLFKYFSKDYLNYYCGIHCSCIKIK